MPLCNSALSLRGSADYLRLIPRIPQVDPFVFPNLLSVSEKVATGQVAKLTAAEQPVSFTTPQIQLLVALYNPNITTSKVYTEAITVPGSPSSFDALPAGTFASVGVQQIQTQFISLAFDPYSATASERKRSGITRLRFTSGATGSELAVGDLTRPITFTLPAIPGLTSGDGFSSSTSSESAIDATGPGLKATCAFWAPSQKRFSTEGCAALPNPLPPGVSAEWRANIVAKSQATLTSVRLDRSERPTHRQKKPSGNLRGL